MHNSIKYSSCEPQSTLQNNHSKRHETPFERNARKVVTTADHPDTIIESNITHSKMLRIAESDSKYLKSDMMVCNIDIVNQHFGDARHATLRDKYEVPITSENVSIHAPKEFQPRIYTLLRKHEHLWSGQLGHIHATMHPIYPIPGSRPFKSTPCSAEPKAS